MKIFSIFFFIIFFILNMLDLSITFAMTNDSNQLVVERGEKIVLYGVHFYREYIHVKSGGEIEIRKYNEHLEGSGTLTLITPKLIIESGGLIDGNGKGYGLGQGPGAGKPASAGGGGGYGGEGGDGYSSGGKIYGTRVGFDISMGSGGGHDTDTGGARGEGGGSVIIYTGNLNLDGNIECNGAKGAYYESGSGAGGGILMLAYKYKLGINTHISVQGGPTRYSDNGGGGGRIKSNFIIASDKYDLSGGAGGQRGTIFSKLEIMDFPKHLKISSFSEYPSLSDFDENGYIDAFEYGWIIGIDGGPKIAEQISIRSFSHPKQDRFYNDINFEAELVTWNSEPGTFALFHYIVDTTPETEIDQEIASTSLVVPAKQVPDASNVISIIPLFGDELKNLAHGVHYLHVRAVSGQTGQLFGPTTHWQINVNRKAPEIIESSHPSKEYKFTFSRDVQLELESLQFLNAVLSNETGLRYHYYIDKKPLTGFTPDYQNSYLTPFLTSDTETHFIRFNSQKELVPRGLSVDGEGIFFVHIISEDELGNLSIDINPINGITHLRANIGNPSDYDEDSSDPDFFQDPNKGFNYNNNNTLNDLDDDNDGIPDKEENHDWEIEGNFPQDDWELDPGETDASNPDTDFDGILDGEDPCPLEPDNRKCENKCSYVTNDTNIAALGTATAESMQEDQNPDYAIDNDVHTPRRGWAPLKGSGWWQVELPCIVYVDRIEIIPNVLNPADMFNKFEVYASITGEFNGEEQILFIEDDWQNNSSKMYTIPEPIQARYLRFYTIEENIWAVLQEFRAYANTDYEVIDPNTKIPSWSMY